MRRSGAVLMSCTTCGRGMIHSDGAKLDSGANTTMPSAENHCCGCGSNKVQITRMATVEAARERAAETRATEQHSQQLDETNEWVRRVGRLRALTAAALGIPRGLA